MAENTLVLKNAALANLGATRLSAEGEDSDRGRLVSARYPLVRDALLRTYPWRFASLRTTLPSSGLDGWGEGRVFPLPPTCLRVLRLRDEGIRWRVEGRTIVAEAPAPLYVELLQRIDNPTLHDALFDEALVLHLTATIAYPITKIRTVAADWLVLANRLIPLDPLTVDSQEGSADLRADADELLKVR